MRLIFLIVLLGSISAGATAQTTECQSIPKASDRLACYDKAAPPTSGKPTKSQTPSPQQGQLGDPLAVENARVDSKLKNICRGC